MSQLKPRVLKDAVERRVPPRKGERRIHWLDRLTKEERLEATRNETAPSGPSPDVKGERVEKFLCGLKTILSHHDAPKEVLASFDKQARTYLTVEHEETFLARAKYLILLPMAVYLNQDSLPKKPDLDFLPKGPWLRWSRQRLNHYSRKNTHLWYSFLQGKRGGCPVSSDIVLANFQKHRDQMEQPDPLDSDEGEILLEGLMKVLAPLLSTLSRGLRRDLKPYFENPSAEVHKASESASFESSRKKGGQAGHLRRMMREEYKPRELGTISRLHVDVSVSLKGRKVQAGHMSQTVVREGELEELNSRLDEYVRQTSDVPVLSAQVQGVLEPFKVRTISKGPSIPYYLGKPVQKALHTRMRKMAPFRLIGRPFCPTMLRDLYEGHINMFGLEPDDEWLSIDYSAATDGLSARLSQKVLTTLLQHLYGVNPQLYLIMIGVLAPHFIEYPETFDYDREDDGSFVQVWVPSTKQLGKKGAHWALREFDTTIDPVMQRNGQLMGSILSFPVLCLANIALYLLVRNEVRGPLAPEDQMDIRKLVLINGDDMIYIGNREEWELHQYLGAKMGLALSPGKAYHHRRYANINSVSVDFDLDGHNPTPREIPFLNVGLMAGNHKVLGRVGDGAADDDFNGLRPLISVINEVVRGSLPGKEADIFKIYVSRHSEEISKEARGGNLFLPISLGGYGVAPIKGIAVNYSQRQLQLAAKLAGRLPYMRPLVRPLPKGRLVGDTMDIEDDPVRVTLPTDYEEPKFLKIEGPQLDVDSLLFEWGMYRQ
jgi:hypothetical protein